MFKEGDGKIIEGMEHLGHLFNGTHLYRKPNTAGGHTYYTDECGAMSEVWDTCLTNETTLLAALLAERQRKYLEQISKLGKTIGGYVNPQQAKSVTEAFLNPLPTEKVE